MNHIIEHLLNKRTLWQGRYTSKPKHLVSSGYPELDVQLDGGVPKQGVVELQTQLGIGELRLLIPFLTALHQQKRTLVFIAPPLHINSEMLLANGFELDRVLVIQSQTDAEKLWAAEQCLKSGCCHTVLLWQNHLQVHQVKRLQLAAQKGDALQVIFRNEVPCQEALPTTLSLQLYPSVEGIHVKIHRRKGAWNRANFNVNMQPHWPELIRHKNNLIAFPKARTG
ncbi:translesion DNA synthesis-associated protein ImuA [Alteromonas sp. a30]|uniref:translesion DNA synthesis-associated protein ImuA n=1 Tax=Alteromonas sp. a30 TaxID=2730917 RepID=UPI00227FCD36|nr:translesion DNA synthesis-associated protein ImuA [Alteromonas sp. a30]MCY7295782.1 translesion DNA synthesis-associated protein ImuA [Alteromonas sp. a30]